MADAGEVVEGVEHLGLPHADHHLLVAGPGHIVPALALALGLHLHVVTGEVEGLSMGRAAAEAPRRVLGGEGVLRLMEEDGERELGGVALGQRVGEEAARQVQAEHKGR